MANVGKGALGNPLIGNGIGSPTFKPIGTNSGLTNHGLIVAQNLGAFQAMAAGVAGQIVQSGGPSANPVYSTATYPSISGSIGNVITSDGTNFISSPPTGGGVAFWVDVTGVSQAMAVNTGYLADNAGLVTLTLPATATQFQVMKVKGFGAGGWKIAQNANQQIRHASGATTVGVTGSLASTNANDGVTLLAAVGGSSTVWTTLDATGNLTIA